MARRTAARRLTFITAAALVAAACGTEDAPDPLSPSGPAGRIRFVNLVTDPGRNPVNVILEGLPFGVNLGYTGSTPSSLPAPSTANYSPVLEGPRTLILKKTADTAVTDGTLAVTITANNDYTVFATGGTAGGAVTAFTTGDVNTAPPAGQARIRVVNMSPTAGAVDVFITAANADLAVATPVATALANRSIFPGAAPIDHVNPSLNHTSVNALSSFPRVVLMGSPVSGLMKTKLKATPRTFGEPKIASKIEAGKNPMTDTSANGTSAGGRPPIPNIRLGLPIDVL